VVSIAPVLFFAFGVKNPLDFRRGYYLCLLFLCVVMTCEKFYFFSSIFFLHHRGVGQHTYTPNKPNPKEKKKKKICRSLSYL